MIEERVDQLEKTVGGLAKKVEDLERAQRQSNKWVKTVHDKNEEMYEYFDAARNGVKVVAIAGNGVMWVAERSKKLAVGFGSLALLCWGVYQLAIGNGWKLVEILAKVLT